MNADEVIQRSERAKAIMGDPLVIEAFEAIECELSAAWRESECEQFEKRETAWLTLRALGRIKECMARMIEHGQFEKHLLLETEKRRKLAQVFNR